MSRKKRFFLGLLLLLLAPTLVLALFAGYAYFDNLRPQSGDLQTWVKPAVVLPGGEAAYYMKFSGKKSDAPQTPMPPLDIVFIVDVSGSMTDSLPAMAAAATDVLKEFAAERPGQTRFALIRFDTLAEITTDWTDNPENLYPGLSNRAYVSNGGTNPRMAFEQLDALLDRGLPQSKKIVVWYTDGGFDGMTDQEIADNCQNLRAARVDIYAVSPPGQGTAPGIIYQMVDDPRHVFNPTNVKDFATNFRYLTEGIMQALGEGGQLSHRLDGRHFSAPLQDTGWTTDRSGTLNLTIGRLPETPSTYAHPLVPQSAGLWSVGVEPPKILFTDDNGQLRSIQATHRPAMLVITWLTLLFLLLPALLWMLIHIPVRRALIPEEPLPLPEILRPRLPTQLPALPSVAEERQPPIPTLFIGLGGAGKDALYATRADLKQAHLGRAGQPYRFLWVDVDTREAQRSGPFDDWPEYTIEKLIAPAEIRQASAYLPELGKTPEHLNWFDVLPYQNATRNELNLAEGSRGNRALARLALFEWLASKGDLLPTLTAECKRLMNYDSIDGTRQIVIFASADGGVGSGWLLDFGRLLHRIVRQQQAEGIEFVPEIIGVLCVPQENRHPENQRALGMEIQSATLSGAYPQKVIYAPNEPLLANMDTESPYNWIFKSSAADANTIASQCGELSATLVDPHPRSSLLDRAAALDRTQSIQVLTHGLHVLPTLIYDQVRYELFLRLIGPDILLDIEPSIKGGFGPRTLSDEAALTYLQEWIRDEPAGTPWQLLLAAASDTVLVTGWLKTMKGASAPSQEWFANAFSASLTRRLHGRADAEKMRWQRDWMPGDAIVTLRFLANRLEQNVRTEIKAQGAAAQVIDVLNTLIGMIRNAADELERWMQDFSVICEKVSRQRSELSQMPERLGRLARRTFIDSEYDQARVEQWARNSLETWLGTSDTVSAIRERLFMAVLIQGLRVKVMVRSCIERIQDFASANELAEAIDHYAQALAYLVPAVRIEGALAEQSEEVRRSLTRSLVDTGSKPQQVLVVSPRMTDLRRKESQILEAFKNTIPQPAYHGTRAERAGGDHSAVRRLELAEAKDDQLSLNKLKLPFVEAAEQAAEGLRQRAEKKFNLIVPSFPAALRIAVAHPEAFKSFARAYKAGHILQRQDAFGADQWALLDTSEFLTFGADQGLATAAANYVWYVKSPSLSFTPMGTGGDFSRLKKWISEPNYPDDETLAQIAIDAYEDQEI